MVINGFEFPPFSLGRLLTTCFEPTEDHTVCILIDLQAPADAKDFAFLRDDSLTIQRHAHEVFYKGLQDGVADELGLQGGELFAYKITGGSNLDLPDTLYDTDGRELRFEDDIYSRYDLILCISTYSATAPLTAAAKVHKFRGATLHGINDIILNSGLSVDYFDVSSNAEKLRLGMTRAESIEIDFALNDDGCTIRLDLDAQEAQKSHGLCHGNTPDIANLPAGEIYYVPTGAEGRFPMKYEDGTIGIMNVRGGRIVSISLVSGDGETIERHRQRIAADPVTGEIGELGFGTQRLPVSGRDIQDEKILGTIHLATGRSDHLGGTLTPDRFNKAENATHDDILFAPHKTPEINIPQVRMIRDGKTEVLIQDYRPAEYMEALLRDH